MIPFHSLHVAPKQDYLNSINFHSFPFLHFKTSNQGCLISLHSILFHSFPLLKYILFLSISLWSFHSIQLPYELSNRALVIWENEKARKCWIIIITFKEWLFPLNVWLSHFLIFKQLIIAIFIMEQNLGTVL